MILLEAGYLSTHSKERTTHLIRAIAEQKNEAELYHNLVSAAECLRDAGGNRVSGDLEAEVQRRLLHKLRLDSFRISRTPITNAQYHLFVQAAKHAPPEDWVDGRPPKAKRAIRLSMLPGTTRWRIAAG